MLTKCYLKYSYGSYLLLDNCSQFKVTGRTYRGSRQIIKINKNNLQDFNNAANVVPSQLLGEKRVFTNLYDTQGDGINLYQPMTNFVSLSIAKFESAVIDQQ